MNKIAYFITGVFLLTWPPSRATGATIHVPAHYTSIQAAIDAAVSGVDEIQVAPGTYHESINFSGKAVRLYGSGGPSATTINGTGYYSVVKCVSGEGLGTILEGFTITGGGNIPEPPPPPPPEPEGFTIVGATASESQGYGGGMYNYSSSPTVTNCIFTANTANHGGGMCNYENSDPTVTDCTFSSNAAVVCGGGVYDYASNPTVTHCTFTANLAYHGGGMYNTDSSPTLSDCVFNSNSANQLDEGYGGGMYNGSSNPTVTNCTFSSNSACMINGGGGSGMFNGGSNPTVTNCTFNGDLKNATMENWSAGPIITDCVFSNNSRAIQNDGGDPTVTHCMFSNNGARAIYNRGGNPTVTDCTFTNSGIDNIDRIAVTSCTFSGSLWYGMCIWSGVAIVTDSTFRDTGWDAIIAGGSTIVINCTFSNNGASGIGLYGDVGSLTVANCTFNGNLGGGICFYQIGTATITDCTNCTFSGNLGGAIRTAADAIASVTNCILWSNGTAEIVGPASVSYSDVQGGYPGEGNIDTDPLFVYAAGGDFHLLPGSPCIDAGNDSAVPSDVTTDLDGNPRIQGAAVDMGAYETTGSSEDVVGRVIEIVRNLDSGSLTNPNTGDTLVNKLQATIALIEAGLYQDALMKLQHDILPKTDGCALTGQPDKDDWITTCEGQQQVYPLVLQAIQLLQSA